MSPSDILIWYTWVYVVTSGRYTPKMPFDERLRYNVRSICCPKGKTRVWNLPRVITLAESSEENSGSVERIGFFDSSFYLLPKSVIPNFSNAILSCKKKFCSPARTPNQPSICFQSGAYSVVHFEESALIAGTFATDTWLRKCNVVTRTVGNFDFGPWIFMILFHCVL